MMKQLISSSLLLLFCLSVVTTSAFAQKRNIIFILSDDHRYDFMSFHPNAPDFLETPNMDRMAAGGAHIQNAFVTTSLCSPSRASILTGQYAHRHQVVDNSRMVPEGTKFFPEELQKAGYETAFFGKWHMGGDSDDPRPGFDHWVSFKGQGTYYNPTFNVNGEHKKVEGYNADLLTEYTLDWLKERDSEKPFFIYLSHKSVHAQFEPAERHKGKYADVPLRYPETMANTEENYRGKPNWVRAQRYGWHGVEHMYHGYMDFDTFYRNYTESLLALDESIGSVLDYLEEADLMENTLVVYMGDNGFSFGEHGLIDKRHAYEESMRVPMLAYAPGYIEAGTTIDNMVLNVDIAPSFLSLAGVQIPDRMQGSSFLPLLEGKQVNNWRTEFLYEYYWEYNFPHTPTVYALRGNRYKYMFYHGIWDQNELYDLASDPLEKYNLIDSPQHQDIRKDFEDRLFTILEEDDAVDVSFKRPRGSQQDQRKLHR